MEVGGASAIRNSPLEKGAKPREIETQYRTTSGSPRGYTGYKDEVLEAKTDKNGNVTFEYATPKKREAADRAASDRAKVDNYMKGLRKKSSGNSTRKANVNLAQQLQKVQSEGKMEVIVNGKRYYRKSKRGSWYA